MKTSYIIIGMILISLSAANIAAGQTTPDITRQPAGTSIFSKMYFGGSFGLQFGTSTLIDISPLVGYKFTKRLSLGVSPTYKYYRIKNYYGQDQNLTTNVLGGSVFGRFMIFENLFAHTEYEILQYNTKQLGTDYTTRYKSLLIGGGYMQRISDNASLYLMALWNLNDTADSPYSNPVIRVGVNVGL